MKVCHDGHEDSCTFVVAKNDKIIKNLLFFVAKSDKNIGKIHIKIYYNYFVVLAFPVQNTHILDSRSAIVSLIFA